MAYSATYNDSEISTIVFDVGLTILVAVGTFATVIGLMIAVNLLRGRKWNGKAF